MAHDPDMMNQEPGSLSRNGLYHCKVGRETVHDIVAKTTDLFNQLKTTNPGLQASPEHEVKKLRIRDTLASMKHKFETLRRHHSAVTELSSNLAYIDIKSLIPYKDDPDNIEQIKKHRRNLAADPDPETIKEKEEILKKISATDVQLQQITNDLRDFIYEINTMIHVSKN